MTGAKRSSTPIAAVDVDGTLFGRFATQRAFLSVMHAAGLVDVRALACLVATYLWHGAGLINDYTARQRSLAVLDGLPLPRARLLAEVMAGRLVTRVRPDARAELARLQSNGLYVMLVSATLDLVVGRLAERLGVDGYLASALVIEDECCRATYSGEVVEGWQKWVALKTFADRRFGPQGWHLAVAYGDSPSDIPLLERSVEPVAVNARPALVKMAGRRGWRQVTWR